MSMLVPHVRQGTRSMAMIRIGGEDYPLVTSSTCRTCMSDHRQFIENELLRGRSYRRIAKDVAALPHPGEGNKPPSYQAIWEHVQQGHLPAPAQTRLKIMEHRAEQVGVSILEGEENRIDHVVLNDLIIQRVHERMMAEEIEPSVAEGLAAIRLRKELEASVPQGWDMAALEQAFMVYFTTAKAHMTPQEFEAMGRDLNRNPILKALQDKVNGVAVEPEPEESGEVATVSQE